MTVNDQRTETLQELKQQLHRLHRFERRTTCAAESISTGIDALDDLLPEAGFAPGTLIEWLADGEATGADMLALLSARPALQQDGLLVVIDVGHDFYPLAAAGLGIDLEKTIVIRPRNIADALWAWEQSLRCVAVSVSLCWIEHLNQHCFRRLQLAAETGGGIGLMIRPITARRQPSWAELRLLAEPLPCGHSPQHRVNEDKRRWRVELLRCRTAAAGGTIHLELNHETGVVSLVSPVAVAASLQRAAGA